MLVARQIAAAEAAMKLEEGRFCVCEFDGPLDFGLIRGQFGNYRALFIEAEDAKSSTLALDSALLILETTCRLRCMANCFRAKEIFFRAVAQSRDTDRRCDDNLADLRYCVHALSLIFLGLGHAIVLPPRSAGVA
ncbi:hypothetical protein AN416_38810 (plasmid) [Paraburkholderia caribensis]|nr:hypothetical protein AN416_38810 [Paraburkholderia caribensis]